MTCACSTASAMLQQGLKVSRPSRNWQCWQAAQPLLASPSNAHKHACSCAGQDVPEHVLASVKHPRLVNAAYFSPSTGRKIATTATDNRIRVWVSVPNCRQLHSQQRL